MPKKIFKKTFSKIIFLIFIFSFIQIFIIKNNVSAYNVPTNGCSFSNATYTAYIISTSDLNGKLPLCFRDNDANNTLTLKVGGDGSTFSNLSKRIKKLSDGTGVEDLADTYTFAGAATHTINYTKNFSGLVTDDITNFFLKDNNTPTPGEATAVYTLTLLPAYRIKFLNPDGNNNTEFASTTDTPKYAIVWSGKSATSALKEFNSSANFGDANSKYKYNYSPTRAVPSNGTWNFGGWCKNNSDWSNCNLEGTGSNNFNFGYTSWTGDLEAFQLVYAKWNLSCNTNYVVKNGACVVVVCTNNATENEKDIITSSCPTGYSGNKIKTQPQIRTCSTAVSPEGEWSGWTNNGDPTESGCTIISYTVTFDTQGGSSIGSQTINYGNKASEPNPSPTKIITGGSYPFLGWCDSVATCNAPYFNFANTNITANKTLYAVWSNSFECSLNYHLEGKTCVYNWKSCTVSNGTGGTQSYANGKWGNCTPSNCNENYYYDGTNCLLKRCGVLNLLPYTTNGTACSVTMLANLQMASYLNDLFYNPFLMDQDTEIINAKLVLNPNTSPKIPIQLKYNQGIGVGCFDISNLYIQWRGDDWSLIKNVENNNSSSVNSFNKFVRYDYGTSSTNYNVSCQNIGSPTTTQTIAFRTPKKFTVKYYNPNGDTSALFDTDTIIALGGYQNGILWDGGEVTRPTSNPTRQGYTFGGWCKNTDWTNCNAGNNNSIFNFENTNWSGDTNLGDIVIYAKWTQNVDPSIKPPTIPCVANYSTTTTANAWCEFDNFPLGNGVKKTTQTCNSAGTTWIVSSSTDYSGCYQECFANFTQYFYSSTSNFISCPTTPTNVACDWKDDTYTKYKLINKENLKPISCIDTTGNATTTYFVKTRNPGSVNNSNYHIATTFSDYGKLFSDGFNSADYVDKFGNFTGKLSIACPTLLFYNSQIPLTTEINCGNIPIPLFTLLNVSANNVRAGTGINIFWNIKNPMVSIIN